MNKNYKKDIESFLDFVEGKIMNPTHKALSVYRRYEKKIKDISTWPDIFGDLYDGIYICHHGGGYYTIDGIHDCFPKTTYKSIEVLLQDHQKGIELTLRSVYENFYKKYEKFLEDEDSEETMNDKSGIVYDFYRVMFQGYDPEKVCPEAYSLYYEYKGTNIYNPEAWPGIFDKILGEKFIETNDDGYVVGGSWFTKKDDCGSYEELYREVLGWEKDVLDFLDTWVNFYKYYLEMREAMDHQFDYCD